jgi:putative ABC transport system permease protein
MARRPGWWRRPSALWRREEFEQGLTDEIQFHIDQQTEKNIRRGMAPEDARRHARLAFGGHNDIREQIRDGQGGHFLETLIQDLRYGLRLFRRSPGFTAIAVLTLALGIGATTTTFSVVSGLMLRTPSVRKPNDLVVVSSTAPSSRSGANGFPVSAADYVDWRAQATDFEGLGAADFDEFSMSGQTTPQVVPGARVSSDFFAVLGVQPVVGRVIQPGDERSDADRMAVLREDLWRDTFGGDRNVLGQPVTINGAPYIIAGIIPEGLLPWDFDAQVWIPLDLSRDDKGAVGPERRSLRFLRVVGRLRPGTSVGQADAQMKTIALGLARAHTDTNHGWSTRVATLRDYSVADSRATAALTVLMAAVGFVLLIACANLAGLLLARHSGRRREFSLRAALGAGRFRLGRQLLTECLLLALAGGALGTLLAFGGVRAVATQFNWNASAVAIGKAIVIDGRVLAFTAAISVLAALVFGLAPAFHSSRTTPVENLKDVGRGTTAGRGGLRLQRLLVIGQLALSLVLLMGAGLLVDAFIQEERQTGGFNPSNVLTASVSLRGLPYEGAPPRQAAFFGRALGQIAGLPQVESAAVTSSLPFQFPGAVHYVIEGDPVPKVADQLSCGDISVSPGYFATMQIPVLEGRDFASSDTAEAAPVAVIDQAFATKYFPRESAIGRHILIRSDQPARHQWSEIVGVVGNVNEFLGQAQPRAHIFEPFLAGPASTMSFAVRTRTEPGTVSSALRRAIGVVDRDQALSSLKTMSQVVADSGQGDSLLTGLMSTFALIALALAAIGIYGVLSALGAQRTQEIGIRMALGARRLQVLRTMMRRGLMLIGAGVAIGLVGSLMLPRLFHAAFYGLTFNGPLDLALAVLTVFGIAVVACWIPARRAVRVDPMVALRHD